MDRIKQVMRLVLICFMLVCCVPQTVMGMQTGEQEITEEDAERFLRDLLEAVKNKDIDKISNELWAGSRTPTDTIFSLWKEKIVSLKLTEKKLRRATAVKPEGIDFHYQIYTKEDEFEAKLSLVRLNGTIKSDDFKLTLLVKPTGTLRTWRTFNIFQWIMLFLAAAEIAFSVYTAWKCFKERPRFTALWIIFILVFYGGISFSTANYFALTFYIYTFAFPRILNYAGLYTRVFLSIPVGAAAYWIRHGKTGVKKERENGSGSGSDGGILDSGPDKRSDNGPDGSADAWGVSGNHTGNEED